MPITGLTGDVGAGKSTLCAVWAAHGAHIIDADTVAREQWDIPEVQAEAEKRWGSGFFTGTHKEIWKKIAEKIFSDKEEYKFASALIQQRTVRQIKALACAAQGVVVVELPLLFEGAHESWLSYVIYAAAPFEKRVERNARRHWDASEVLRRDGNLLPQQVKIAKADLVLENNGTAKAWREKAEGCWPVLVAVASGRKGRKVQS